MNDLIGLRFGRLTVLETIKGGTRSNGTEYGRKAICLCDCGVKKEVWVGSMTFGRIKSCGCLKADINTMPRKHGLSSHPLYSVWKGLINRCTNVKDAGYKNYGGRGITVCDEWLNDMLAFIDWGLNNGFEQGLELDRINNNGGYSPYNCRFVTIKVNSRNRRNNRLLTYKGRTKTLAEWSEKFKIQAEVVSLRIGRGWTVENALKLPLNTRMFKKSKPIELIESAKCVISDWDKTNTVSQESINRLKKAIEDIRSLKADIKL